MCAVTTFADLAQLIHDTWMLHTHTYTHAWSSRLSSAAAPVVRLVVTSHLYPHVHLQQQKRQCHPWLSVPDPRHNVEAQQLVWRSACVRMCSHHMYYVTCDSFHETQVLPKAPNQATREAWVEVGSYF